MSLSVVLWSGRHATFSLMPLFILSSVSVYMGGLDLGWESSSWLLTSEWPLDRHSSIPADDKEINSEPAIQFCSCSHFIYSYSDSVGNV